MSPGSRPIQVPTVELLHTCDSDDVHLLCLVTGFSPAPVTLQWLVNGQPLSSPETLPASREATGATFQSTSSLNVTLGEWQEKIYSCKVMHAASESNQEVKGHKCMGESGVVASPGVVLGWSGVVASP
uniref:Ig-like domain-containing protein n=1 Tax=Calidris pygmaea TaxID=425635 RepID=A0A8C3J9L0_9CHAR